MPGWTTFSHRSRRLVCGDADRDHSSRSSGASATASSTEPAAATCLARCPRGYDSAVTSPSIGSELRRSCWLLALTVPLLIATIGAEPLGSIPNPRTRDGTWVTDMPGALRAETVARLNSTIGDLERTNGAEMAVVVVKSLDGLSVEEAAVKLFELWGIGKKSKDNGLLLLWSTGDRRVRVEVGYGLEGTLPDGKVGAILDTYVIPKFKAGDFDQGLIDGVDALVASRAPSRSHWRQRRVSRTTAAPGELAPCWPASAAPSLQRLVRSPDSGAGGDIDVAGARGARR